MSTEIKVSTSQMFQMVKTALTQAVNGSGVRLEFESKAMVRDVVHDADDGTFSIWLVMPEEDGS